MALRRKYRFPPLTFSFATASKKLYNTTPLSFLYVPQSRRCQTNPSSIKKNSPQPIQPGMVDNCDKFYFVSAGDGCSAIASSHGITFADRKYNLGSSFLPLVATYTIQVLEVTEKRRGGHVRSGARTPKRKT